MTELPNPLLSIVNWLDQLPPDHRHTLSAMVVHHLPDIVLPTQAYYTDGGAEFLRGWLSDPKDDISVIIGKVVIMRALIDFTCNDRFTKTGQELSEIKFSESINYALEKGHDELAAKMAHSQSQSPLRNAQWSKAGDAWKELCKTELSDESLRTLQLEAMRSHLTHVGGSGGGAE